MILPFSTQLNGKPTQFVEKVLSGLLCYELEPEETKKSIVHYSTFSAAKYEWTFEMVKEAKPKFHTIREDKKKRWNVGTNIDFFINCRQKDMFRFAPVLPVVDIQRVFMTYLPHLGNGFELSIDGKQLMPYEIEQLAVNDGFDSVEEFENYFISVMKDNEFSGKLIHWTDFKY